LVFLWILFYRKIIKPELHPADLRISGVAAADFLVVAADSAEVAVGEVLADLEAAPQVEAVVVVNGKV
jgi:hypothetical protein